MDACPKGTAESYAGNSYWLADPSIILTFPADWYACTGDIEIPPDQVLILLDPKGPNTLLLSTNGQWDLDQPDQHVELHFNFTISGSMVTSGWLHGAAITEDATIQAATIVYADPTVRSNSYLTPQARVDSGSGAKYDVGEHRAEAVIELTSNRGICSLKTYGLHFG